MAAKMMLNEVKAPLLFIRRSALAFSRSKTAPSNGELAQKALAQPAVLLRRYLYRDYSSKTGIRGLMDSGFGVEARESKRVDDADDSDDSDSDYDMDNYDASDSDWSD